MKETAIVDDNVEEKDSNSNSSSTEETEETKEFSSFSIGDKPLSPVELKDIWELSSKVTADIIHGAATKALNTDKTVNNLRLESIKQCHRVSQYSYLLKNGLEEDQTEEQNLNGTDSENMDNLDKVSNCSCSDCEADPETRTPAKERMYCIKCGHYVVHKKISVSSMDSNSSDDSDISTSSSDQPSPDELVEPKTPTVTVIIDGHNDFDTDNKSDDVTPTPSPHPSPATTPTRESMSNVGLTSITEVSDSCEVNGNVDIANNNINISNNFKFSVETKSTFTNTRKDSGNKKQNSLVNTSTSTSTNGTKSFSTSTTVSHSSSMDSMTYVERKDSNTSMSSEMFPRKESIASTNSIESNCDEDEERDVVGPFKYKRDLEKTFGSSLRLNMIAKKVSTM